MNPTRRDNPRLKYALKLEQCPWCGQYQRTVRVSGHDECSSCHRPIRDCCDGETATAPLPS